MHSGFEECDLQSASFKDVTFNGVNFPHVDLRNSIFDGSIFEEYRFFLQSLTWKIRNFGMAKVMRNVSLRRWNGALNNGKKNMINEAVR